ncbi:hypothetical protein TIFTF001_025002 [Ficus carica]|uniref:Uncharacterized protein n=1 Tax=Ficus carica TaxID=3494 RepID=A0AA88DDU4_FICCA|nr:hypothetical protein TIFTF001_025002 [Ficus carica]
MDSPNTTPTTNVQHVTKKSSDELLRKFADPDTETDTDDEAKKVPKRRRRSRESGGDDHDHQISCESPFLSNGHSSSLVERRSLLPVAPVKKSALLRQLGIRGRAHLRAREIRHKSLFGTIGKLSK